jgi:V/A-type H+/Na+-transporting ATPase subunit D
MADTVPTRSAFLQLQEERRSMQEGYRFLDEKRLVLAGEILDQLRRYEADRATFDALYREALAALDAALGRHGLEGLWLYPPLTTPADRIRRRDHWVLGVPLVDLDLEADPGHADPAVLASPEAERCRAMFREIIRQGLVLAAHQGNLQRLWEEYQRSSRRARALEDVLLPEIEADLGLIDAVLEEQEREDAVRVRHFCHRQGN